METVEAIRWHPAYRAGMELTLWEYRDDLEFREEVPLGKEPPQMDLLIIKKRPGVVIHKNFGRIFRTYNIVEYKSPKDSPNIDDFFQLQHYVSGYKTIGRTVDEIPTNEITGSLFHHGRSAGLIHYLRDYGIAVEPICQGVYAVTGFPLYPIQIVACQELPQGEYAALRSLTFNADEQDVRDFLRQSSKHNEPAYRSNVDAVLYASAKANMEMFKKIGGETVMNEVMRELMREDLIRERTAGRTEGRTEGRIEGIEYGMETVATRMIRGHRPADEIMTFTELPLSKLEELANKLGTPLSYPQ